MNYQKIRTAKGVLSGSGQRGVALVLTLLVIAILTVVVVGFTTVVRLEQVAAKNATFKTTADQMAQLATGEAMRTLRGAVPVQDGRNAVLYASSGGRILMPGGNRTLSTPTQGAAENVNLNAALSDPDPDVEPGWIVGDSTQTVNVPVQEVRPRDINRPIGRFGYFIDDESVKIPMNAARGARATLNPGMRPYQIEAVTGVTANGSAALDSILNGSFSRSSMSNWPYFFTSSQIYAEPQGRALIQGIGPTVVRELTVAAESVPAMPQTPWGTDKVQINAIPLNPIGVDQIAMALTHPSLANIFGGLDFEDKYGEHGVRQIAANMLQMRDPATDTLQESFTSIGPRLGAQSLFSATGGRSAKLRGIPNEYLGYAPFPSISEVGLNAIYGYTARNRFTLRILMTVELVNPFSENYTSGGQVVARMDKARFGLNVGYYRGPEGSRTSENDSQVSDPWDDVTRPGGINEVNSQSEQRANIPNIAAGGYATVTLQFDTTFDESNPNATSITSPIYAIIDQVRLLRVANDDLSVRDWISGDDMYDALQGYGFPRQVEIPQSDIVPRPGPGGRMSPTNPLVGGLTNPAAITPTRSFQRVDPRMRRPALVGTGAPTIRQPWFFRPFDRNDRTGAATPGRAAGDELPSAHRNNSIPGDPVYPTNLAQAIWPTDRDNWLLGGQPGYLSVADLGKVYTGLPWRKIRLQPQPASELPNIPDWVMMDIFDFGNGPRTETPVNLNSLVVANGVAITRRNSGVRSLLQVLSNRDALTNLADPRDSATASVSQQLSTDELNDIDLTASGINDLANRLSQPSEGANWSNSNTQQWFRRREDLRFPRDGFLLPSEVTEIAGIADFVSISTAPNKDNVRFKANEQRLAALFPMLQTRGRFFTIYAIGEAMEGDEVVATRYLNTLVQVDNTANPPAIRKILQQPY